MDLLGLVRINHNHSMSMNAYNRWMVRLLTMVLWAAAAASGVWWGLRVWGGASQAPTATLPPAMASAPIADPAAVARLLGAVAPAGPAIAPAAASRFVLLGVMASPSKLGSALIAVDGKPGRAFRVGSKVDEGIVLEAVEPRKARLASVRGTGESIDLELPVSKQRNAGGPVAADGRSTPNSKPTANPNGPE